MVGGGVRLQSSENFTASLEKYGTFQERALTAMELELLMGSSGPFKGLHWVYSMEFYSTPWYWRMSMGSGISGLEKDMELIDTFMVQLAFGYTFSDSYTRKPIVWDTDCYNQKYDDVGCRR